MLRGGIRLPWTAPRTRPPAHPVWGPVRYCFFIAFLCLATPARADTPRALSGGIGPDDIPTVLQSRPLAAWSLALGLQSVYAHRETDGVLGLAPTLAVGLFKYLELGASLPSYFVVSQAAGVSDVAPAESLRTWGKIAIPGLLREPGEAGLGMALTLGANLPASVRAPGSGRAPYGSSQRGR